MGWLYTHDKQAIIDRWAAVEGEKGWVVEHSDRCNFVKVSNVVIDQPLKKGVGRKPKEAERDDEVDDFVGDRNASAAT